MKRRFDVSNVERREDADLRSKLMQILKGISSLHSEITIEMQRPIQEQCDECGVAFKLPELTIPYE